MSLWGLALFGFAIILLGLLAFALHLLCICPSHLEVSLNYCSQNGGHLYRAPYYNRNLNIGPRIDSNLGQSPFAMHLLCICPSHLPCICHAFALRTCFAFVIHLPFAFACYSSCICPLHSLYIGDSWGCSMAKMAYRFILQVPVTLQVLVPPKEIFLSSELLGADRVKKLQSGIWALHLGW